MRPKYLLVIALLVPRLSVSGDVLQHHRNGTRNGLYIDPLFTQTAAERTHRDLSFTAALPGPTYAQPLFITDGPRHRAACIAVTEQNAVLALEATNGRQLWASSLGSPVPLSQLPCGDIDPLSITGTPVIDPDARVVYVAAMTTSDDGATKQQKVFALSLDNGTILPGWPIDVSHIISG